MSNVTPPGAVSSPAPGAAPLQLPTAPGPCPHPSQHILLPGALNSRSMASPGPSSRLCTKPPAHPGEGTIVCVRVCVCVCVCVNYTETECAEVSLLQASPPSASPTSSPTSSAPTRLLLEHSTGHACSLS